jgi:uncharacterized membrane protein YidH (DUF202 family)
MRSNRTAFLFWCAMGVLLILLCYVHWMRQQKINDYDALLIEHQKLKIMCEGK